MAELEGIERHVLRSGFWKVLTQRLTLPWVLRFADLPEQASVLEVGSGGGFNAEVFLKRFPRWILTISDYDPEMVDLSRDRLARFPNVFDFRQADATQLPFSDDSFDVVISIFVWAPRGGLATGNRRVRADSSSGRATHPRRSPRSGFPRTGCASVPADEPVSPG